VKYKTTNDMVIKHPSLFQHKIKYLLFWGFNPQITISKTVKLKFPEYLSEPCIVCKKVAGWLKEDSIDIWPIIAVVPMLQMSTRAYVKHKHNDFRRGMMRLKLISAFIYRKKHDENDKSGFVH